MDVVGLTPGSLDLGMVAHWPCDAEGGSALVDSSGNRHDGTLAGASWIAGRFDGAVHFDSGSSVPVPAFPQATRSWSVALWYRAPAGDQGNDDLTLISTEVEAEGGWAMTARLGTADRRYQFSYLGSSDAGDPYQIINLNQVEVETWVHLVAVVDDATMQLSFYQNGELAGTSKVTSLIQTGNPDLYLGCSTSQNRFLVGDLDDIVIFSRALVQSEIQQLYVSPAPHAR